MTFSIERLCEALARQVVRLDAVLMQDGEEVLIVHEEWVRQIAHVGVGRIEMAFAEGEDPFLNRQYFRNQFRAGQGGATGTRILAEAMPEAKEAAIERERLAAERFRPRRLGQIQRTQQVSGQVRPAKLTLANDIGEADGQAVTAQ